MLFKKITNESEFVEVEKQFSGYCFPDCLCLVQWFHISTKEVNHSLKCKGEEGAWKRTKLKMSVEYFCYFSKKINGKRPINSSFMESPFMENIFQSNMSITHKSGYCIQPSGIKRHVMYFIVDTKWPIFGEPDFVDATKFGMNMQRIHDTVRKVVHWFLST